MQDDVGIEAIQNQNLQNFVETLLYGCSEEENFISFDESYKKIRSLLTLCKA